VSPEVVQDQREVQAGGDLLLEELGGELLRVAGMTPTASPLGSSWLIFICSRTSVASRR
jgi:hypothetical protein